MSSHRKNNASIIRGVRKRNIILLSGVSIMFKLNDNKTGYEVYDDDGIYEETVKATLENMYDLIDKGYTFQQSPPVSGDHDHCYGCATMRHPCSDEVIL